LGQHINGVDDIRRIGELVRANSRDLLQAEHTLSGIDMALWDLLGKVHETPVYSLLGTAIAHPKRPYASQLFGDTPAETFRLAQLTRQDGYTAAKFGWGPFGLGSAADDADQIMAAREGMGLGGVLLIDAGAVWIDDVSRAEERLDVLKRCHATWLEEPFVSGAFDAYRTLADAARPVTLAAGEGCHNAWQARHLIDYAEIGFIQIDAGKIGGITPAADIARYAQQRGVTYVNHTFTSHLALSASLQPFAGHVDDEICEYPVAPKSLAFDLTCEHLDRDADGLIHVPNRPGLGMTIDIDAIKPHLVDLEIRVHGQLLYSTPQLDGS